MDDQHAHLRNDQYGCVERIVPSGSPSDGLLEREHRARYQWDERHLGDSETVLDIACGVGYGRPLLVNGRFRDVVSSDISLESLSYGRSAFDVVGVAADGEHLPFHEMTFDSVVSLETIEHVPEPAVFLSELRRVLKVGGTLLISTPNLSESGGSNPHHLREFTRPEFEALLLDGGFAIRRRFAQRIRMRGSIWRVKGFRRMAWKISQSHRVVRDGPLLAAPLQFCWICERSLS
jgi:SAM-dependent methyltransferase